MPTIDELGRTAAHRALTEAATRTANPDADLAKLLARNADCPTPSGRRSHVVWVLAGAAALVAGAVIVAISARETDHRVVVTPVDTTPTDTTSPVAPVSAPAVPSTSLSEPTTVVEPTTGTVLPVEETSSVIDVPWMLFDVDLPPCQPEACPSAKFRSDGSPIAFDRSTSRLSTLDQPNISVPDIPAGTGTLIAVGPDDVAYLAVTAPLSDEHGDLIAVPTTGSRAGFVIARTVGVVDPSGDTDIVATRAGLRTVGCCGSEPLRPDLTNDPAMGWVDNSGNPTVLDRPDVQVDVTAGVVSVIGSQADQTWKLPADDLAIRGMPAAGADVNGRTAVEIVDAITGQPRLFVFGPDGSRTEVKIPDTFSIVDLTARAVLAWNGYKYQRAAIPAFTGWLDVDQQTLQRWNLDRPDGFATTDEAISAAYPVWSDPNGCRDVPTTLSIIETGIDPHHVGVEQRFGCDDAGAGAGTDIQLTLTTNTQQRWTVSEARQRYLCLRGASADGCA